MCNNSCMMKTQKEEKNSLKRSKLWKTCATFYLRVQVRVHVCVCVNHSCHIPNPAGVIKWEESGMKEEEGGVRGEMGCF